MRIAALSPQFVVETPEDPQGDAERVLRATGDEVLRTRETAPSEGTSDDSLSQETRSALRRLSKLIVGKSGQNGANADNGSGRGSPDEKKREGDQAQSGRSGGPAGQTAFIYWTREERAFSAYQITLQEASDEELCGQFLNVVC